MSETALNGGAMAYWTEDKISDWEDKWFDKSLSQDEYTYIAQEHPGYFLLLLHIWNNKKWEHDWIWVDEPYRDKDGNKQYRGRRTYDELNSKVRAKGFAEPTTTEYNKMTNDIEQQSLATYKEQRDAINKLKEIW